MEKSPFVRTVQGTAQPHSHGGSSTLTGAVKPQVSVAGGNGTPQRTAAQNGTGGKVGQSPAGQSGAPDRPPVRAGGKVLPGTSAVGVLRGTLRTGTPTVLTAAPPVTATVQAGGFRRSEGGVTDGTADSTHRRRSAAGEIKSTRPTGRSDDPCGEPDLAAARQSAARTESAAAENSDLWTEACETDNDRPKPTACPANGATRPTGSDAAGQPTLTGGQDLAAAFAAAERARLAALRSGGADSTGDGTGDAVPLPGAVIGRSGCTARCRGDGRCADAPVPDYDTLDAALLRGIGWGAEAGSTLTNSTASALLLDWGEDNRAAHQSQRALTAHIRKWLDGLDRIDRLNLYENWPRIARHADELVRSTLPSSGRLTDAGSPNRRTDYSPVHWAAVRQAVEQALNGTAED